MEDIRLGRELASAALAVSLPAATPIVIAGADPKRTRVCLSGDGSGTYLVTFDGMVPAALTGFALTPTSPIMVFTIEEFGKVITGPVTVQTAAGAHVLSVVLSTLERTK